MNNSLNNMKNNNLRDDSLLNAGLSLSSQSLNETSEFNGIGEEGIPRSGSLPDMSSYGQSENSESWQTGRTKKGSYLDHEELNLNDLRELVIYHPIEEEDDESDNDNDDDQSNLALNVSGGLNTSNRSPVNKRKSRKRDSAALFDISLEDLTEPDFAGILKEKHSEKLWWCVLIDQHLCIFPSQDPDEVAYDVIIMPCCQIALDDRLMRTPVFRLTQSGMAPWVFVASNNDELKEWMKVLTIAASAGKHSSTQASHSDEKQLSVAPQAPLMQSIMEEEEEPVDEEDQAPLCLLKSDVNPDSSQLYKNSSGVNESEDNPPVSYVNAEPLENGPVKKEFPELPKRPDEVDGEQFGNDIYEAVVNLKTGGEGFQDDGFATDEFDSGSSDEGGVSPSPQTQPVQQKAKKKKQFFHWLKKKSKKGKLFSSPKDGVALAGYAHKLNDSTKRWFLIREQKLHCYKTIKDDDPETTVDLDGCEIKAGEEERNKLAIQVVRDGSTQFTLVAKSAKDWERWKKAFLIESGFIKLAVSPTDTSSGVFDQEDEDDYVTPIVSPGLEKSPTATEKPNIQIQLENNNQSMDTEDEDLYMEVVPSTTVAGDLKQVSPSSSQLELGPLPPVPPDLPPPRSPEGAKAEADGESGDNSGEYEDEIYEEVTSSVAHADKVIKWDGVTSGKLEGTTAGVQNKHTDKASKGPMPAGVSDGSIEDSAITASSFLDSSSKPCAGRLNLSDGAWCAKTNDKQQYLQIDLGEVTKVCGVASQGRPGFIDQGGWFVKTYTLAYSKDGENWTNYKEFGIAKVFQGNNDPDTVVTNMLKMAVNAHYVRIKPQSWHNHIAMRVEVYKGEASSKLTAGIHKLAGSLAKSTKKKSFDRQNTPTSPTENQDEDDTKASYVDRHSATENLLNGDGEKKTEEQEVGVENDEEPDDYLQLVREPSSEEKEVELKVQQKIEALKKGEEGSQPIGKHEVSQSILAKKSLYESSQQSGSNTEQKTTSVTKVTKETVVITKKEVVVEKRDVEERERKESNSSQDPDREREVLEKTEQAFQNYAKQLKKEGSQSVREKKPSLVALSRLNFEDPRTVTKTNENASYPAKMESLLKEKEELLKKMENLKKRIGVAKDRKIFFSLSTTRSKATADADAEFHESQCDLAKTKKRLLEIESETKNLKVMELRYQKTPEKSSSPNPNKPFLRKNSRECKLGSADIPAPKLVSSAAPSEAEKDLAQKGSVLSQIKAFEQMKKTSEK
ncbi:uncharacterized protein LOC144656323 isoform X3 [Oculina patagonica]